MQMEAWWPPVDDRAVVQRLDEMASLHPPDPVRAVHFNRPTWERWLVGDWPAARVLGGLDGETVSRSDLQALAAQLNADDDMVALFVAVMVWGSGTSNGRGPRNTARALADRNLLSMLQGSRDLVLKGDIAEAYGRFRLAGVGPAFYTKWFWAVGLPFKPTPRPLILDSRVWASLGFLGWDSRTAAGTTRWGPRYRAYLEACERWAGLSDQVDDPEQVEQVLFHYIPGLNGA